MFISESSNQNQFWHITPMARYGSAFFDSGVRYDAPNNIQSTNMMTLTRFLDVPFDDPRISLAELLGFSTDHLARMIANNTTGELTPRITATTSALGLVDDSATDDETKLGLRKARKRAKGDFREALPAKVAKIIGGVVAQYGAGSLVETECCPLGRTIYTTSTDDQIGQRLQTLLNGVTAHVADLGAPLVAQAQALVDGWDTVYAGSETAGGAKTSTQEAKKAARENLQLMLFLNLLKLAEVFARQPEKLALYMRQSLLEDHPRHPAEPPTPPTPPTP